MKWPLILPVVFLFSCSGKNEKDESFAEKFSEGKWIDLTYDFSDKTIYWPTANGFKLDTAFNGVTPAGFYGRNFKKQETCNETPSLFLLSHPVRMVWK